MALGMPVISTNVGGIPYLFENDKEGIMLPPNNVMAFVTIIRELLENSSKVESLSFHARQKAQSFDWEHVKTQWPDLLNFKNAQI